MKKIACFISGLVLLLLTTTSCSVQQNKSVIEDSSIIEEVNELSQEEKVDIGFRDNYEHKDKYIVFFLTNTSVYQAGGVNEGRDADKNYTFVSELSKLYGIIDKDQKNKYAFGLPGPMLLTQSIAEMNDMVHAAFDLAETNNVPVYFQLDDCNNYTSEFGNGVTPKYYENPDWSEWTEFPGEGEEWGGESNGRLPYYWFNWGDWRYIKAFPCFESIGFREFIVEQMQKGVLEPLNERYKKLRDEGKEYLFAGMSIGWETHIPDYSTSNTLSVVNPNALPVAITDNEPMQEWEATTYGYNSLHQKGYKEYNKEELYQVIHDYSELLAKTAFDSGIPKSKIYTHIVGYKSFNADVHSTFVPPIWTAVNDYSTPGFTLSPETCPYNLETLIEEIKKADESQEHFVNAEGYARGVNGSYEESKEYFNSMFSKGALMVSVYGWGREPKTSAFAVSHDAESPFVKAAKDWIDEKY